MKIGLMLPQGIGYEFRDLESDRAWDRIHQLTALAEELGFESVWLSDHFHCHPEPTEDIVFEAFTTLSALAALTKRIRLGHLVLCAAYRNAALTTKMISTVDTISGGRAELGLGAGWKQDEWLAYGYGFPEVAERLAILADHLEIAGRMLGPGKATWTGQHAAVIDAVNVPKSKQHPRLPILVGGNGRRVTWRLAARYADELNLDGLTPDEVGDALPVIADHCRALGRQPETLRVSLNGGAVIPDSGPARVRILRQYADQGLSRLIVRGNTPDSVRSDTYLKELARDAREAGLLGGAGGGH